MHIGLIGGIGPAATVFYYERLVAEFSERDKPLLLTIGHSSAAQLSRNVTAGNTQLQAEEFNRISHQLAAAGADTVVISSMGGHFCAAEFAALSPLPMIHGPDSVAHYLKEQGIRRIGILGTRIVMKTSLYGVLKDLDPVSPSGDDLEQVNDDYIALAVRGSATKVEAERMLSMADKLLRTEKVEAILLGGTDLNLIFDGSQPNLPVIDSAEVHVNAIVKAALESS